MHQPAPTPPKIPRPSPAPRTSSPLLSALQDQLALGELTVTQVEERLQVLLNRGTPLIEAAEGQADERIVTFLYRHDRAEQVLLFVNRLTDERNLQESLMERFAGTRYLSLSYRMVSDWRASYCFIAQFPGSLAPWEESGDQRQLRKALDSGFADPHNELSCLNSRGRRLSVVELEAAPEQPFLSRAESREIQWTQGPGGRLYRTIRLGTSCKSLPVVFLLDGETWLSLGLLSMLEAAVAEEFLPPCVLVLVHSGGKERRWREQAGGFPYADYLADELLPLVLAEAEMAEAESCLVVGQSLGGLSAISAVLRRPEVFSAAFAQSASLWHEAPLRDLEYFSARYEKGRSVRLMLEVGEQEWVLKPAHEAFVPRALEAGIGITCQIYNGGHDYACWRGSIIPALRNLLAEKRLKP